MLLTSQITICFGIYSYTHNRNIETGLYYASITLFLGLWAILEIWHKCFLNKQPVRFNEPLNEMTQEEFEKVNKDQRKLVILDDLVLDVTLFAQNHPGGRFLLDRNVGKDISKYFHGGYSFEQGQGAR